MRHRLARHHRELLPVRTCCTPAMAAERRRAGHGLSESAPSLLEPFHPEFSVFRDPFLSSENFEFSSAVSCVFNTNPCFSFSTFHVFKSRQPTQYTGPLIKAKPSQTMAPTTTSTVAGVRSPDPSHEHIKSCTEEFQDKGTTKTRKTTTTRAQPG